MIIIKGGSRCNGAYFAKHLVNPDQNETVKVAELRGLAARNIGQALFEMKAVASGTRCIWQTWMNRQINEFEWRLFVAADPVEPTSGKEELQSGA